MSSAGPAARASLRAALAAQLTDIDWDSDAKLMRSTQDGVQFNIEQHTEFVSLTIIDERADGLSPARNLPDDWLAHMTADIVVAVDCFFVLREEPIAAMAGLAASRLEDGLADAFFDFKVAEDGHSKISTGFDAGANVRDIGRLALQVIEIETYRSFAALGLPQARQAQAGLADIAARVPADALAPQDEAAETTADADRFADLSALAAELEAIWRDTSFRFAACQAPLGVS